VPISINVRSTLSQIAKDIARDFRSQIPFATAKALTATAQDLQVALNAKVETVFDRPTPFTKKAIGITIANKSSLTARVFVKDIQAQYLGLQIEGGTRTPKGRALVVPAGLRLNQYGNIPRGKLKALLARADVFSGRVGGVAGIWQRTRKGPVKLLIAYEPTAKYRRRLPFYETARAVVSKRLVLNFGAALTAAIRTAR